MEPLSKDIRVTSTTNTDEGRTFDFGSPLALRNVRKKYLSDSASAMLGGGVLTDYYPDAGNARYEEIELGKIKNGPRKGEIGMRLYGETLDFAPIRNKDNTFRKKY